MSDHTPVAHILDRMAARAVDLRRQLPSEKDLVDFILVRLPRIGGCVSAGEVATASDLMEELILKINGLITRSPDHADVVTAMMTDLNALGLAGQIWGGLEARAQQQTVDSTIHRRTGEGIIYARRIGPDGQMVLVESRPHAKARDFYVHRPEYDRAAKALGSTASKEGAKFPVLYEAFAGDDETSEYVLRVVLRFWRTVSPPLIERQRSRYRAVGAVTRFRKAAAAAWDDLAEE